MKYFKRKKIFSHYSLDSYSYNKEDESDMQCDDSDGMDTWDETDTSAKINLSKLPVVLIQKLHIDKNIYADGKFVGVAVCEENYDVPTSFIISPRENLSTSINGKETSDLNKASSEILPTEYRRKEKYKCSLCKYSTSIISHFKHHSLVHSDERPFSCPKCSYKAKRKNNLQSHLLTHRRLKRPKRDSRAMVDSQIHIEEQNCKKKPNYNENSSSNDQEGTSKSHTNVQGMRTVFKCSECDFETKYKENLPRHVDRKHNYEKKPNYNEDISSSDQKCTSKVHKNFKRIGNIFKCSECDFETKYKKSLTRHVDKKHNYEKKPNYNEDSSSSDQECSSKVHKNFKRIGNIFKCSECDFETKYKKSLKRHVDKNHKGSSSSAQECTSRVNKKLKRKENIFKCLECDFETKYKENLPRHVDRKHNYEKKPTYNEDSSSSDQECTSRVNKKLKRIGNIFKCSQCDYKTKYKINLTRHVDRKHNYEKKPNHNENNENSSSSDQTVTSKVHTNVQGIGNINYKCSECDFQTKHKHNLTRHTKKHLNAQQLHSTDNNFRADEPSFESHFQRDRKEYSSSEVEVNNDKEDTSEAHPNVQGIENIFKCSKCDFETKYSYSLMRHEKNKHLNVQPLHCTDCDFTTDNKNSFESHLQCHSKKDLFSKVEVNNGGIFEIYFEKSNEEEFSNSIQDGYNFKDPIDSSSQETDSANKFHKRYDSEDTSKSKSNVDDYLSRRECSDETIFEPSESNFKTKRRSAFNSHTSQHIKITTYECPECDFETIEKTELDDHVLIHNANDEPNYESEEDSENSDDNSEINIKDNVAKQSESRWYKCPQCSFKVTNARFLDTHIRTHYSKTAVHECSVCNYRTKSKQNFKVHMFKHSNTIPKF